MYFPLLFPCRPVAALTHAVNDKLSFNEVDTSVRAISTSVEQSLRLHKKKKKGMFILNKYIIFYVMFFFFLQFDLGIIYTAFWTLYIFIVK